MELISCFQKERYEQIQLGMPFEDFQKVWSPTKPLNKKLFKGYPPEVTPFACYINHAEFMFTEDQLSSVQIKVLEDFFNESKQVFNHLTLDKTVQQWTEKGWGWSVYQLYTVQDQITLICNELKNVSFEFLFRSNKFKLHRIRVDTIDVLADHQALIRRTEHNIKKLTGVETD